MKTAFRKSFTADLKKIHDQKVLDRVRSAIEQAEEVAGPRQIANLKKLHGSDNYYRIRVGDYRIGVAIEKDIIEFVRCLPRRELYRFFP
jgi:mRNA interferase RelE/StbE